MQLKLFVLPIKNLGAAEAEMNAFLRGHRVLAVKKEFVADGENSFWSFCVEYLDGTAPGPALPGGRLPKVDYKEVLKPEEFEVFSRLREWRKTVAEKEGSNHKERRERKEEPGQRRRGWRRHGNLPRGNLRTFPRVIPFALFALFAFFALKILP